MRRSRFLRNKKNIFVFFIVLLFFMTIGFSYLSTSLSLSGNLTVKGGLFDVTFDANGGSIVDPVKVLLNGTKGDLPETDREGYDFLGWYSSSTDGDKYENYNDVESNITLYAHWEAHEHILTINNNGGSGCSNQTKKYDEVWDACTPTRNGYTLSNWSTNFGGQKVTGDVNSTANWTPTNYTITWNLNSGFLSGQKTSYNIETAAYTLPTPTRSGYDFGGWFENSGLTGTAVTTLAKGSTGNKTYYAKWTVVNYTITWNLNNGSLSGQKTSYNVETAAYTLPTPTRNNYNFGGWYENSSLTGTAVTTLAKGSTGNKTYYAKWNPKTYTITLNNQSATTAGTTSVNVTYGSTTLSNITVPTRTDYTFAGYYTSTGGGGTQRINKSGVWGATNTTFTANTTLYAYWDTFKVYDYQSKLAASSWTHGDADVKWKAGGTYSNNSTNGIYIKGNYSDGNGGSQYAKINISRQGYKYIHIKTSGRTHNSSVEVLNGTTSFNTVTPDYNQTFSNKYNYTVDVSSCGSTIGVQSTVYTDSQGTSQIAIYKIYLSNSATPPTGF